MKTTTQTADLLVKSLSAAMQSKFDRAEALLKSAKDGAPVDMYYRCGKTESAINAMKKAVTGGREILNELADLKRSEVA